MSVKVWAFSESASVANEVAAAASGIAQPASLKAAEIFHETDITNYWGAVLLSDWTQDGRSVIFVSDKDGDYHLYRMPATGGEPVNLTRAFDRDESNPLWSPDGKAISFEANIGANLFFFSVPAAGGPVKPLIGGRAKHKLSTPAIPVFADTTITEITCHARGVHHLAPDVRTLIEIGGQDSKCPQGSSHRVRIGYHTSHNTLILVAHQSLNARESSQ
jgi:hypothetical protein